MSVAGAVMTSAGVAAGLVVLDALCGRFVRRPFQDVHHGLVTLTGCDSGLGFSLARHSLRMGLCVVAGCLDPNGEGARRLRVAAGRSGRLTVIPLDVTKQKSVNAFVQEVTRLLETNPSLRLLALVNNAGVMVFGEFDWQTEEQVERQVEVNLLGTMRVTKAFCPLLRSNRSRLVVVSSHCALESLPGLASYGASKAALEAWSNALRVEQAKYGVRVITLVPGSFSTRSNIMARHEQNARDMEQDMRLRRPQDWEFHKDYFQVYHSYLKVISGEKGVQELHDAQLYFKYECSLLALLPKQQYIHAPMRYNIYHSLMRMAPRWLRDEVVKSFMQLPAYKGMPPTTNLVTNGFVNGCSIKCIDVGTTIDVHKTD